MAINVATLVRAREQKQQNQKAAERRRLEQIDQRKRIVARLLGR